MKRRRLIIEEREGIMCANWKFIDSITCTGSKKKYHQHVFEAKYLKATHVNVYDFSCEIALYVMRWQEGLRELDPDAHLQVGMSVYYLPVEIEYPLTVKYNLDERDYERLVCRRAYEKLEPRELFKNMTDFQREMVVAWQKACFIGVPSECRNRHCPLLEALVLKVHYEVEKLCFMKYAKL